jgi:membrane associated rhomboid family serine protease
LRSRRRLVGRRRATYVHGTAAWIFVIKPREPVFNVPAALVATLAVLCLVHLVRVYGLTAEQDVRLLLLFAFIPARYEPTIFAGGLFPGGLGADVWTFFTYAFIHADVTHLGLNSLWLLPFGSALARRFGPLRFFAFLAVTAAAGAAAHLATHIGQVMPVIGASAAVSGTMAAAMRFAFQRGGPLSGWRSDADAQVPAAPLGTALRDRRVLAFVGVWFALNLLFGIGAVSITGGDESVAWQAHIGGFVAGLLLFAVFDPIGRPVAPQQGDIEPTRQEGGS